MLRLANAIATFGGVGFFPIAPGTAGSAVALALYVVIFPAEPSILIHIVFFAILAALFFIGVWASTKAETAYGHDPSCVVIDEVVGMGISLLLVPKTWTWMVLAFVLFRIMDISKRLGIDGLQRLRGGWGIMMDDVAAGLWTMVFIRVSTVISSALQHF